MFSTCSTELPFAPNLFSRVNLMAISTFERCRSVCFGAEGYFRSTLSNISRNGSLSRLNTRSSVSSCHSPNLTITVFAFDRLTALVRFASPILPLRLLSPDESMDCRTGENSVHSTYVLQVLLTRETAESDRPNLAKQYSVDCAIGEAAAILHAQPRLPNSVKGTRAGLHFAIGRALLVRRMPLRPGQSWEYVSNIRYVG